MESYAEQEDRVGSPAELLLRQSRACFPAPIHARARRTIPRPGTIELRDAAELATFEEAWQELAAEALEPNVFHEPWMLLPAIRAYGTGRDLRFVLVFVPGDPPTGPAVLAGVFPLELKRAYRGIPVTTLSLWRYPHCFLGTPLIHRRSAEECLDAFFAWVTEKTPATLLELGRVSGEGDFHRLLLDQIARRRMFTFTAESYLRALFEPAQDADSYLQRALTGRKRKELRRQANRLAELGSLEFRALDQKSDLESWIDEFLRLEASGWKGEEGTALASTEEDRSYFHRIARGAFERGCLSMLALRLDQEAIAMKLNVTSGPGAFALKVAFNEEYARFSPGVCLEIENIRRLHHRSGMRWMDSCAEPDHPMIDHLWTERRLIQSVVVSTNQLGDPLVSVLPFLRWLHHRFVRGSVPATNAMLAGGRQ